VSVSLLRACALGAVLALVMPRSAQAGGLYLLDRGARPLSRAGAFVAGADDPHALWYNPAGLDESGDRVLLDGTLTVLSASYRRSNADGSEAPRVEASRLALPIPTMALSHRLGLRHVTFGAGIFAPNAALLDWPRSIVSGGERIPGPTRYSLISLRGSALATLSFGAAYHRHPKWSVGADVGLVLGRFRGQFALSACGDGVVCSFPEDPAFDGYATLDALPAWAFTGGLGVKYRPVKALRVGLSASMPYVLRGPATVEVSLPRDNPILENAELVGDRASIRMKFPLIVRAGVELRPTEQARVELAAVYEQWSSQQSIDVRPEDMVLTKVRGVGDYKLANISLARGMRDTYSVRLGGELRRDRGAFARLPVILRIGAAYERGAFSRRTLTPLTIDTDKLLVSAGLGVELTERVRLDLAAGWYAMRDVTVTESTIARPQALRPATTVDNVTLGNGRYTAEAGYLGGGLSITLP
jgi:long-chain fatty acid transport protein